MACFYAMNELQLPFETKTVFNTDHSKLVKARDASGIKLHDGTSFNIFPGSVTTSAELVPLEMFTLRVCKECRGTWMAAIKRWFKSEDEVKPSPGTGIFVRRNGVNVEITEEEWERENPGRKPIKIKE